MPLRRLLLLTLLVWAVPGTASATTFTVGDAGDDDRPCQAGSSCTLRAAIAAANRTAEPDQIRFDLPADAVIRPQETLPSITAPVDIDARRVVDGEPQPGPVVAIDGAALPLADPDPTIPASQFRVRGANGLTVLGTSGVAIRGLAIHSFPGAMLMVRDAAGTVIQANHLGTDLEGHEDLGRIAPGGIDTIGVYLERAPQTLVGGAFADRNVVSGLEHGIDVISSSDAMVVQNYVGVTADGISPLGNDEYGVVITHNAGGSGSQGTLVADNIVAASGTALDQQGRGHGIAVLRGIGTRVLGNYVGFNAFGQVADMFGQGLGPAGSGIVVLASRDTEIGEHDGENDFGNHIAGAGGHGIRVEGTTAGLRIRANIIGLDAAGSSTEDEGHATGNEHDGIAIDTEYPVTGVEIGGPAPTDANVVAGNKRYGIRVVGAVSGARVIGNRVGVDAGGRRALGNGDAGVVVDRFNGDVPVDTVIGEPGAGNLIAGERYGVVVMGGLRTRVQANLVGFDADGNGLGVAKGLVVSGGGGALIGGAGVGEANLVADAADGVVVTGQADATTVRGNGIGVGLDLEPDPALGANVGIEVVRESGGQAPTGTTIGGAAPGQANVVAASGTGVLVRDVTDTTVRGNVLGLAGGANGTGIRVQDARGVTVGGTTPEHGNRIGATTGYGVVVRGKAAGTRVAANRIGTVAGSPEDGGVLIEHASDVVVGMTQAELPTAAEGCTGACNEISDIPGPGVAVRGEVVGATVLGNRYRALEGLSVDLGEVGPSKLDARDEDSGPNDALNRPALVQEVPLPRQAPPFGQTPYGVSGVVETSQPGDLTVAVFGQADLDTDAVGDGFGQEAAFLGFAEPDRSGRFLLPLTAGMRRAFYSAQAIDGNGSTSEFALGCGAGDPARGADTDHDAICDAWELHGVDLDGDGADVDLAALGATVGRRDVFLEVDATSDAARPAPRVLERVRDAFAAAPALRATSDGRDGPPWNSPDGGGMPIGQPGIDLHILGQGGRLVALAGGSSGGRVDAAARQPGLWDDLADFRQGQPGKTCSGAFGDGLARASDEHCFARRGAIGAIARYALFAEHVRAAGEDGAGTLGLAPGGEALVIGIAGKSDSLVQAEAKGDPSCANPRGCRTVLETYTLMHELGHTLGLLHRGAEDDPRIDPANLSVMGDLYASPWAGGQLDYSHGDGPVVDEHAVDETIGVPVPATARARGWQQLIGSAVELHEGVRTCVAVDVSVKRDLNRDGGFQVIPHGLNEFAKPGSDLPCRDASRHQTLRGDFSEWPSLTFAVAGVKDEFRAPRQSTTTDPELRELADLDADGVVQADDVCPHRADPAQADADGDGIGDACVGDLLDADVALALDGPRQAAPGEEVRFTLTVTNDWPRPLTAVDVAVAVPAGLEVISTDGDGTFDAEAAVWHAGELAARGERRIVLTARPSGAGDLRLSADVARAGAAGSRDPDSTPGNGDAEEDDHAGARLVVTEPERLPVAGIADARTGEGTRTRRSLRFVIGLDRTSPTPVTMRVRTAADTAAADADFVPLDRTVEIPAGERELGVEVDVVADSTVEPAERVRLVADELVGATAGKVTAVGTIVDDDAAPLPGHLVPFGCASARRPAVGCTLQDTRMADATGVAAVGDRDAYAMADDRVVHLQRDVASEAWTVAGCIGIGQDSGACTTPSVDTDAGERPALGYTDQSLIAATPDGRWVIVATSWPGTGSNGGIVVLRRDPASGELTFASCTDQLQGIACTSGPGSRSPDALVVSPDSRDLYLLNDGRVQQLRITEDGRAEEVHACTPEEDPDCPVPALPRPGAERAVFTPDGTTLLVRSIGRVTRLTRAAETGALTVRDTLDLPGAGGIAVAPDGRTAFVGSRSAGTITVLDLTRDGLAPGPCVQDDALAEDVCAERAAGVRRALGLVATQTAAYAPLDGGAVLALRRTATGLADGRCTDPETGTLPCDAADPSRENRSPGWNTPALTADGRIVLSSAGSIVQRFAVVQPQARENRPPICGPVQAFANTNRVARIQLSCADFDGDALSYGVVGVPSRGQLEAVDTATGELRYRPSAGFRGRDAFAYRATDARGGSAAEAPVTVDVGDEPPRCSTDELRVLEGARGEVAIRCEDPEGAAVQVEVLSQPAHGTASLSGTTLAYQAAQGWTGSTEVKLRGTDADGSAGEFTAQVVVVPPPPPPVPSGSGGSQSGGGGQRQDEPRCRRSCRPNPQGEVEYHYYCGARRTDIGGYASCELESWMIVCRQGICQQTRSQTRAAGAALRAPSGRQAAHGRTTIPVGQTGTLRLRLNASARRQLLRDGVLRVQTVTDVRDADGKITRMRQDVTVRAPVTLQVVRRGSAVRLGCRSACSGTVTVRRSAGRRETRRVRLGGAGTRTLTIPRGTIGVEARITPKGAARMTLRRQVPPRRG